MCDNIDMKVTQHIYTKYTKTAQVTLTCLRFKTGLNTIWLCFSITANEYVLLGKC